MVEKINPKDTDRAWSFEAWKNAVNPMVVIFSKINVTKLKKVSKKTGLKFNMLLCYCILKASRQIKEFFMFPTKTEFLKYDELTISVVAPKKSGGLSFCYVPFSESVKEFSNNYNRLVKEVYETEKEVNKKDDVGFVGTSAIINRDIDGLVNMYNPDFTVPYFVWGKYRKKFFRKYEISMSLNFNHIQMDGQEAAESLNLIQKAIDDLTID